MIGLVVACEEVEDTEADESKSSSSSSLDNRLLKKPILSFLSLGEDMCEG